MHLPFSLIFILLLNEINCANKGDNSIIDELFPSPTLVEGKKFSITCQISKGKVDFDWLKNNEPIIYNENIYALDLEESSILNIRSMSLEYAGEYTCRIKSSSGQQDRRSIFIKLKGKNCNLN